jgi:hypothetical protein
MSRNAQIKQERRRRNTSDGLGKTRRLALDESKLDRENFEYRWVNDVPGRIHHMTVNDDWDVVTDHSGAMKDDNASMGAGVSAYAGVQKNGSALSTVLLRKPKDFCEQDRARKQEAIKEMETAMVATNGSKIEGDRAYLPENGGLAIRQ